MFKFEDFILCAIIAVLIMVIVAALAGCGGGGGGEITLANGTQQPEAGTKNCRVILSKAEGGTGDCIPF